MGYWPVILLLVFTCADARQNATQSLRAHTFSVATPNVLVLLGQGAGPSCQCTFEDQCSCAGALKFMDCVKKACNSGECECMEKDGTNHFLESCSAMADECGGIGLKCMAEQSTCKDSDVAWHSKVKQHAMDKVDAAQEVQAPDPKKYVLHTKYKATVKEMHVHAHREFAQGIMVTIMVLSVTIALASSANTVIASNTWSIIDFTIVTFLALAWFIVVIHGLDYFQLVGLWKVAVHMVVSVLFLLVSVLTSWNLRSNESNRSIFDGIFTPMTMWCNAGFVTTVQKYFKDSELYVFLFLIVLVIWYGLLAVFFHYVVSKATSKGWADGEQNHMAGGALAAGFVLWSHMMVTGSYHSIEGPRRNTPTVNAVAILNALSVFYCALSLFVIPVLSRKAKNFKDAAVGSNNYWKLRICGVGTWFFKLAGGFSFVMSLGHFVLEHTSFSFGSVGGQLALALVSSVIGIIMIALCAYVPFLKRDTEIAVELSALLLHIGGLMVGVAWSGVLDNSISMMVKGEGYSHPFLVKLGVTTFLSAFVFPVYCWYLKPIIMTKTA